MKVSVLIPVFNVEEYLVDCIESVLGQTHKEHELILVNDGSTDGSPWICDEYAARYPDKIRVIHTENRGPLYARAQGAKIATGDILMFLDSDDCYRVDALERIANCFHTEACDMVLFNTGNTQQFPTRQISQALEEGTVFDRSSKQDLYKKVLLGKVPNSVCLKAVRATCAQVPERFFGYTARHGEDLLLSVHYLTGCDKIVYLNEGLYFYRDRPGSAVRNFDYQRKDSIKVVHTELAQYIDLWQMPELKPLHNARKVNGWIETLKFLMKNRESMTKSAFKAEMRLMSRDPYFRSAYTHMDTSMVPSRDRLLAWCLYTKQCYLISLLYAGKKAMGK